MADLRILITDRDGTQLADPVIVPGIRNANVTFPVQLRLQAIYPESVHLHARTHELSIMDVPCYAD